MAPFMGNLDVPSRLPQWKHLLPPPPLLPGVLDLQVLQALPIFSHSFHMTDTLHKQNLVCHLVALVGVLVASPPTWWHL